MADLEIIGIAFSNYVRSVRMLCAEKGIAYTHHPVMPQTPEVKAIHPAGQVPVMRHGDVVLFESKAIATYVDRVFPGPKLIPDDPVLGALVEQWVSYGNVMADRWIMREFVVPSRFFDKAKGPDTAKIEAALPKVEKVCGVLDAAVAKTGYLVGNGLTYADCNVLPMLTTLAVFPQGKEILGKMPNLSAYVAKLSELPSFTTTAPPPRK